MSGPTKKIAQQRFFHLDWEIPADQRVPCALTLVMTAARPARPAINRNISVVRCRFCYGCRRKKNGIVVVGQKKWGVPILESGASCSFGLDEQPEATVQANGKMSRNMPIVVSSRRRFVEVKV